jgi:hypothetical protein
MKKKAPESSGDFDADVDDARKRLEASLRDGESEFDDLGALQALAPLLKEKIKSRRLTFALSGEDDDDETSIAVIHVDSDEELGFIFAEDGEYVFESNLDAYFDDFVDEDAESFVTRLYETLRADLAKYEVENKG